MIVLAIDTSTRWAGVAVVIDSQGPVERVWRSNQNHGRELMPAVLDALRHAGAAVADVTHLAVALGPGGFSALRVGISTVIGLAMPRSLPAAGIPSFDIEAAPHWETATAASPLYALIPSGRGELAWASYVRPGLSLDRSLATAAVLAQAAPAARFCGEGAEEMKGLVEASRIISGPPPTRSPGVLARLAVRRFQAGEGGRAEELRPVYGRQPSVTNPALPA